MADKDNVFKLSGVGFVENSDFYSERLPSCEPDGSEDWQFYNEAESFIDFVNPGGEYELNYVDTEVWCRKLPFYNDGLLVWVQQYGDEGFVGSYLKCGDHIVSLGGDFGYFCEINETGALNLTRDNVLEYLKLVLFNSYDLEEEDFDVFALVENEKSEFINGEGWNGYYQGRVLKSYQGARVISAVDGESFNVVTRALFDGHVYELRIKVFKDGFFDCLDEKIICKL